LPDALVLSPRESLFKATEEDLRARFTTASSHELNVLLEDFRVESAEVEDLIQNCGLEQYLAEVQRLLSVPEEQDVTDLQDDILMQ